MDYNTNVLKLIKIKLVLIQSSKFKNIKNKMPDEYKNYEKKDLDDSSQYYLNINSLYFLKMITKLYNTLAPK